MQDSKLIKMLKKLDKDAMLRFYDFVHSPYFNKHERLKKLVLLLQEKYPDFTCESLSKQKIFSALFPSEKNYQEQKINDLMSYLVTMLQDFFSYEGFKEYAASDGKLYMLQEILKREYDYEFERLSGQLEKKLEETKQKDQDYYYLRYKLETEHDNYFKLREKRGDNQRLQNKVDYLDIFYISAKLKAFCEMLNRQNVLSATYQFQLQEEILSYVKLNWAQYANEPSIAVYYQILLTLQEPENETHFTALKDFLEKFSSGFSEKEARELYDYAQNYCIKKINKGRTEYLQKLLAIYKSLLIRELIFENGYLSQWDYKNIVSIGLRLEEFGWTESFIHNYRKKIHPDFENNAFTYNLSAYYFSNKQYSQSLKLLQNIEFSDTFYHLGSKSTLLKIYFETEEDAALTSLISNFKIYLKRNKTISAYQRTIYFNLLSNLKTLSQLREKLITSRKKDKVKKELEDLKNQLIQAPDIANASWIIQQTARLIAEK